VDTFNLNNLFPKVACLLEDSNIGKYIKDAIRKNAAE
jgi:hypothetical protein